MAHYDKYHELGVWMSALFSEHHGLLHLTPFTVADAPTSPGIYAWYIDLPFGPMDWEADESSTLDGASLGSGLLDGLRRFAAYYSAVDVELRGKSVYESQWSAVLRVENFASVDASGDTMRPVPKSLVNSTESELERRLLVELLSAMNPVFAAPAYIGVATDLRVRLQQHLDAYQDAMTAISADPTSDHSNLVRAGKDLGTRLAGARVPLEDLSVWVLPTSPVESHCLQQSKNAAESAEWVIQRIFRPALGRR